MAARADGTGMRATVSASDGVYSFADVVPGAWSLTSQADGYADTAANTIDVQAGKAARTDILMVASVNLSLVTPATNGPATTAAATPAPTATVVATRTPDAASDNIWSRWAAGQKVSLRDINRMYDAKAAARNQTASLTAPVAALFDKAAVDADPFPQTGNSLAPAVTPATTHVPRIPEALEAPEPTTGVDNFTPFAYGDFTWLNGTPRNKDTVLDTKFFTPEIRFDTHYMQDFNQPLDHTIVGATESFRSGEVQIEQASVGGDFHWQNVRGRILFMQGLFASTTPRNDGSSATGSAGGNYGGVGQWDLQSAYKYVSEAWGGYHFNVNHGLNVDAGIFVSYIGLFSYYNFDNWTYQPSYVSSNTPWFFNGLRAQWFVTNKLKIEPWLINGWQSYAKFNGHPGLGGQLLWMPKEWFKLVANQYGFGQDNLGAPNTERIHTDDSIEVRFYNNQEKKGPGLSKIAMSLTGDAGSQYGGGICATCGSSNNKNVFLGWMAYNRYWWDHDTFAVTLGGGMMNNPGRYLTLLPPIDGAWASTGSVYFPETPGSKAHMYDGTVTFQYMPKQYITWWAEMGYRHSDVPYFAGRRGVTPPGGNNGFPQYYTCNSGATAGTSDLGAALTACGGPGSVWFPDLRRSEAKLSLGVMVKF
jgi:hypothetical protein